MPIPETRRAAVIFAIDLTLAALSYPLSLYLRLGWDGLTASLDLAISTTIVFTAIAALVLWWMRLDRIAWRYVSVDDALLIGRTSVLINLLFLGVLFLTTRLDGIPRSSVAINVLVLAVLMAGGRMAIRLGHERQFSFAPGGMPGATRTPVMLIGATDEAEAFIRKMARDPNAPYTVVGILGNGDRPVGSRIRGVTVLGTLDDLAAVVGRLTNEDKRPTRLIIADAAMRGEPVQRLLDTAASLSIPLSRLPELSRFQDAAG